MLNVRFAARLCRLLVTFSLVGNSGCGISPPAPATTAGTDVEVAPAEPVSTPAKLLARIQRTLEDVEATAQLYEANSLPFRRQHLADAVRAGLDDVERMMDLAESTPEQQQAARWLKAQLLGYGGLHQLDGCAEELREYAGQLEQQYPGSSEAEMAAALLLREITTGDQPYEEVLQALQAHTRRYPQGSLGLPIYHDYALRLAKRNDIDHAIDCCLEATQSYPSHPQLEATQQLLISLTQKQASATRYINRQNAHLQDVYRRVGYRREGYFVIDAQEQKKFGLVGVEYFVCHGIQEVADQVHTLPKDWEWKLHAWYPDTQAGLEAASQSQAKLLKGTVAIPTFEPRD